MNTSDKPVDLAAKNVHVAATDWKVLYGYQNQFAAYFSDQEAAMKYARTHHGVVIPLGPV